VCVCVCVTWGKPRGSPYEQLGNEASQNFSNHSERNVHLQE